MTKSEAKAMSAGLCERSLHFGRSDHSGHEKHRRAGQGHNVGTQATNYEHRDDAPKDQQSLGSGRSSSSAELEPESGGVDGACRPGLKWLEPPTGFSAQPENAAQAVPTSCCCYGESGSSGSVFGSDRRPGEELSPSPPSSTALHGHQPRLSSMIRQQRYRENSAEPTSLRWGMSRRMPPRPESRFQRRSPRLLGAGSTLPCRLGVRALPNQEAPPRCGGSMMPGPGR